MLGTSEQLVGVKWVKGKLKKGGGGSSRDGGDCGRKCTVEDLGWGAVFGCVICPLFSIYITDWYCPHTDSINAWVENHRCKDRLK